MRDERTFLSKTLTLVCAKCTRTRTFGVPLDDQAAGKLAIAARSAGWVGRNGQSICPKCPQTPEEKSRRNQALKAAVHGH